MYGNRSLPLVHVLATAKTMIMHSLPGVCNGLLSCNCTGTGFADNICSTPVSNNTVGSNTTVNTTVRECTSLGFGSMMELDKYSKQ
jgi:hypothetical protein